MSIFPGGRRRGFSLVRAKCCASRGTPGSVCPVSPAWHVKGILHPFSEEIGPNSSWCCLLPAPA